MAELVDEVLTSLRRILRATSMHSRRIGKAAGLTAPQLLVLREVQSHDGVMASEIARAISLSPATVTLIINKLEGLELVTRERSTVDRRRTHISLTDAGHEALSQAPQPLQESFSQRFDELQTWEKHQLVASLEKIAAMMDAEDLDAAPVLTDHADIH